MYRTWPAGVLVGLIFSAEEVSWVAETLWRVSIPWTFPVLICWQACNRRKKNPRTRKRSPLLGHRLAALQCPLLAKPNIAPAVKGEIRASSSSSIIKQDQKKKKGWRERIWN